MKKAITLIGVGTLVCATALNALADPDNDQLVIEGMAIATEVAAPAGSPFETLYSGWRFRSDATQQLETDDFENPGMVFVEYAGDLWENAAGTSAKSCADCHGDISSFKGLRASMPKWDEATQRPITLEQLISRSIKNDQGADPWKWESQEMLSMTALIGLQSRGMPVDVQTDGPMAEWAAMGKELYYTRVGQLDMACANCHEDNWGNLIRSDHLSQGHINGFPVYRLKWQGLGSIHRRFKGCMKQVRATPYKVGGDEFTALQLYLAARGTGLPIETPSVRN